MKVKKAEGGFEVAEIGIMKVRRGWGIWGGGDAPPVHNCKGEKSVRV